MFSSMYTCCSTHALLPASLPALPHGDGALSSVGFHHGSCQKTYKTLCKWVKASLLNGQKMQLGPASHICQQFNKGLLGT